MPFLYVYVCDLLENLSELYSHDCPTLIGLEKKTNDRVVKWFQRHKNRLNEFSVDSRTVMMFFMPQKQTDRIYGLDVERLEQLIARVLGLSRELCADLQQWRQGPAHGDLGACVKRVMDKMTGTAPQALTVKVTVEDIDQVLLKIASHDPNSSLEVRSLASRVKNYDTIELLGKIYRSLGSKEAKWFTRLVLKSYGPIKFPERLTVSSNTQFLPNCIHVNAEISIADMIPALRDGAEVIKGTAPGSTIFKRGLLTPAYAPPKRVRVPTESSAAAKGMSTPSTISPSRRGESAAARVSAHVLPTPLTTPTHLTSSANALTPARNGLSILQPREPLASLDLNSTPSQQSSQSKAYEASSSALSVSNPRSSPTRRVKDAVPSLRLNTPRALRTCQSQRPQTFQILSYATPSRSPRASSVSYIKASHLYQPSSKSSPAMTFNGAGTCLLTSGFCPLTNCIFILSPCISNSPYIAEDLLSWHGSCTITSLCSFSDPSLPRYCPRTGKRYRKIALVETNRTKPTAEFIARVSRLNLMRRGRGGEEKKEWIEVFDWRILEAVAKLDRGEEKGYNPWRRNWVGAV